MNAALALSPAPRAATGDAAAPPAPPFPSVLCGVGAGRPSLEAARQAAVLASGGRLTLVAIGDDAGVGPERAELAAAFVLAGRDSDQPDVLELPADGVLPSLLLLAGRHDLLVVGAHDVSSGREDITRAIVHQSPVPVLVARQASAGADVVDRILVASADPTDAAHATAAALGTRHRATVLTVALGDATPWDRDRAAAEVLDAAVASGATLVVISSRGLAGVAGLASVSAAVAARAGCSVLVLRPPAPARGVRCAVGVGGAST